jgi:hypothetical protein
VAELAGGCASAVPLLEVATNRSGIVMGRFDFTGAVGQAPTLFLDSIEPAIASNDYFREGETESKKKMI